VIDFQLFDSNAKVLLTLRRAYEASDGGLYLCVWGTAGIVLQNGSEFVQIGGFGNEMLISASEIRFAQVHMEKPTSLHVLILGDEYNDIIEFPAASLEDRKTQELREVRPSVRELVH